MYDETSYIMAMKKLPNGILKDLSERTGIHVRALSDYAGIHKRPSVKRSIFLEKHSGVHRATWAFGSAQEIKNALISEYQKQVGETSGHMKPEKSMGVN